MNQLNLNKNLIQLCLSHLSNLVHCKCEHPDDENDFGHRDGHSQARVRIASKIHRIKVAHQHIAVQYEEKQVEYLVIENRSN